MFLKVLLHQYRYSVSALFTKQYSQLLLMFFSVVLNFVLVNSIKEYVPSSDTTGNQVYCLKTKQKKSLALASVCPLKCLFVCTASHCVNINYSFSAVMPLPLIIF